MLRFLTFLLVLTSPLTVTARQRPLPVEIAPTLNPDRTVSLDDNISHMSVANIVARLYSYTRKQGPVTILIDSAGGEVQAGQSVITAMQAVQAAGSKVECLVTGIAASMAAWIYLHCDARFMVPNALVLYHFGRVTIPRGVMATAFQLMAVAKSIAEIDAIQLEAIKKYLPINPVLVFMAMISDLWFDVPTLTEATNGQFFKTYVPSAKLFAIQHSPLTPRMSVPGNVRNEAPGLPLQTSRVVLP